MIYWLGLELLLTADAQLSGRRSALAGQEPAVSPAGTAPHLLRLHSGSGLEPGSLRTATCVLWRSGRPARDQRRAERVSERRAPLACTGSAVQVPMGWASSQPGRGCPGAGSGFSCRERLAGERGGPTALAVGRRPQLPVGATPVGAPPQAWSCGARPRGACSSGRSLCACGQSVTDFSFLIFGSVYR